MVFSWNLSDSKSPQVSRTLPNYAVVWMVSIHPPISNSSSFLPKPLRTVPSMPIMIGTTATLTFHSFLSSLARSKYLSLFLHSLIFTL